MRTLMPLVLLILVAQPFGASNGQQPPQTEEFKMTTYQAVFVTKGPKWTPGPADVMPLGRAHSD